MIVRVKDYTHEKVPKWKLKYVWKYKSCLDPQIKTYDSIDFTLT